MHETSMESHIHGKLELVRRDGAERSCLPPEDRGLGASLITAPRRRPLAVANLLAGERSVALLEARTIGTQATGRSTAKATSQHGPIYRSLLSDLGEAGARDYAEANEAAIGWIAGMADGGAEVCERAEAYVFAETETEAESLRAEAEVAARLGIRARFEPAGDLPFPALGRLAFAGQAQINPYLFLRGLARRLEGRARIHERTRVTAVEHGAPCILRTERGTLHARWVIVATQIPTVPEGKFFARAFPHADGVVAARVAGAPVPPGMDQRRLADPLLQHRPGRLRGLDGGHGARLPPRRG
jgi:hypothetical protein